MNKSSKNIEPEFCYLLNTVVQYSEKLPFNQNNWLTKAITRLGEMATIFNDESNWERVTTAIADHLIQVIVYRLENSYSASSSSIKNVGNVITMLKGVLRVVDIEEHAKTFFDHYPNVASVVVNGGNNEKVFKRPKKQKKPCHFPTTRALEVKRKVLSQQLLISSFSDQDRITVLQFVEWRMGVAKEGDTFYFSTPQKSNDLLLLADITTFAEFMQHVRPLDDSKLLQEAEHLKNRLLQRLNTILT